MTLPLLALALATATVDPAPTSSRAADPFDENQLAAAVWQLAPDVLGARRDLIDVEAVRDRSHLLPNPSLTATWGTIPLGHRTGDPVPGFWDVPSYTVGLSQLIELGKRGPRQRAADAARAVSQFSVLDAYLRTFFAVLETLSDQAAAFARRAVLERLVADSRESLRLQGARADKGDLAPLEVDRLEVDHSRLLSSMREAEAASEGAAIACGNLLGARCPRFAGEDKAWGFLLARSVPLNDSTDVDEPSAQASHTNDSFDAAAVKARPDLQALRAEHERLSAELTLAARQAIPDPVASVGVTHDQFIAAGNQSNSVNLSLTIPVPAFDRGQTEAERARRRLAINETIQQGLIASVSRGIADQRRQLQMLAARAHLLGEQAVPRARGVVERTEEAFRRGGMGFPDVLLARRAFEELQLDRIEVATAIHRAGLNLRRLMAAVPWPAAQPRYATTSGSPPPSAPSSHPSPER
jgi:cobalt-zinc-cadmium efflux system outer membrane protein